MSLLREVLSVAGVADGRPEDIAKVINKIFFKMRIPNT